jgi:hypothetical protein
LTISDKASPDLAVAHRKERLAQRSLLAESPKPVRQIDN